MTQTLYPVGDGIAIGNLSVINGVERHSVLRPFLQNDDSRVEIEAMSGYCFDQRIQSRGPILFGDGILRVRLARTSGEAGIQLGVSLWNRNPKKDEGGIIAEIDPINVWHNEFREYTERLIARQSDWVAENMNNLWLRVYIIATVNGIGVPILGVSSLGVETPDPSLLEFQDPSIIPPTENSFVTVRTYSGRTATARYEKGEWYNEDGSPFEIDKHSLPLGADENLQASRGVNGWASEGNGLVYGAVISDTVQVEDSSVSEG